MPQLAKNGLDQTSDKQDVDMPKWVAERLRTGKAVNPNVFDVLDQVRVKPKNQNLLSVEELKGALRAKDRGIDIKISMSGEECKREYSELFSGVGLIRGEYPIRKNMMWITLPEMQKITKDYVEGIAEAFTGKDVWYRTIEVPTTWVNVLDGCDHKVNEKTDTVVGLRGIRRSLAFPETFLIELDLIADVSKRHPNLNMIFPYVHDVSEVKEAKKYVEQVGFKGKIGMMAEIPSSILSLEKFIDEGVSNITIGLNDLTALTLGSLRSLPIYNNTHPAVFKMMEIVTEKSKGSGVELVVAGHHNPKSVENSEKLGFDAVSIFVPDLSIALR